MIDYMADNTPSLVSDNVEGIATLVDYVYNKGHRKIAYIYGNPSRVSYLRLQSFKESLKRHKLDIRDEYLIEGDFHNPKLTESLTEKNNELQRSADLYFFT
jgi:DNA-binding LacI/PurR family transcriptional regulator